ncbi:hypothetical protein [Allonocardiopsis opalescens]|uniref:Uncharacterized protein n=1 Tax=Allonocardiopsis opalescens TaxID=1144618 RepID=A0A2T0PWE5_9ACTN|nr:hypothetical protein [Allonocardiopsis opalescens]PRX95750.1 hypothetical protein CLV72_109363 [Allonocardiopsis opalescens]
MTPPTPPHIGPATYPDPMLSPVLPAPPEQCFVLWVTTTPPGSDAIPVEPTADPHYLATITDLMVQALGNEFRTWLLAHSTAHPTEPAWITLRHLTPTHQPDTHQLHGFTLALPRLTDDTPN